ncbi:MAG TPA: AMP-binding protein, partial [Acidimicrobiales bacterium]|nr:AMP-binding protein [Acidimicrobiales bacterium]
MTLPAAWAARWSADPSAAVLHDEARGWVSAGWLEEASRAAAGRYAAAGLVAGDRVLFSTAPSVDLVVAHVAALRSGLVTVPVNTASTAREIAHVVTDAGVRGAV